MKKNRRRNYFIKKKFQSEVILKIAIVWLIGVLFGTLILYFLSKETITAYYYGGKVIVKSTADIILEKLILSSIINFFITLLFGAFIMLFISHRLAGPLYRFEKTIEEMAQGNLGFTIRLREKDELVELVPKFNVLLTTYNERLNSLKELVDKLKDDDLDEEERKKIILKLEDELSFFKTK